MNIKKIIAGIVTTALVGTTMAISTVTTASADTIGQAWIMMQQGNPSAGAGVANWNATDSAGTIDITGNGSYTISFDIPEGCGAEKIDFLGISTDINTYEQNAEEVEIYKNMTFDIDSILVDGVEIEYSASSNASGTNDDGTTYRLSIYDTWSGRGVQDIDNAISCSENITINFTVNGIIDGTSSDVVETEATTVTETPVATTTTTTNTSATTAATTKVATTTTKSTLSTSLQEVTVATTKATGVTNTVTNTATVTDKNGNVVPPLEYIDDTTTTTADKSATIGSSNSETTTASSSDDTNPSTGDGGLGAVVVALSIAGLSVVTLTKRK